MDGDADRVRAGDGPRGDGDVDGDGRGVHGDRDDHLFRDDRGVRGVLYRDVHDDRGVLYRDAFLYRDASHAREA